MSPEPTIPEDTLGRLLARGEEIWRNFEASHEGRHHLFVPCDQRGAYRELRRLAGEVGSMVEFGSAAGVVTILADLLGIDAYGIEIEAELVEEATALAAEVGSRAVFAEGSFVPESYRDETAQMSPDRLIVTEGRCGYRELGMELSDFDLVFAYPWPGENAWLDEMVRRHARPDAILLTYDVTDGFASRRASRL